MAWARNDYSSCIPENLGTNNSKRGYQFKLCPYSTQYRDFFKQNTTICTGVDSSANPLWRTGELVLGNSNDPAFYGVYADVYLCSDHSTTEGRMVGSANPPGWLCDDPACYYYTAVDEGHRYKEV